MRTRLKTTLAICLLAPGGLAAAAPDLNQILARLERLEQENRSLRDQVRELRKDVAALGAPETGEKLAIQERRVAEQAQTKVEASQKLPIRVTGMALFNVYANSSYSGGLNYPKTASLNPAPNVAGATFRQSILGLEYHGAETVWGGQVRGSLYADFYGGSPEYSADVARIRTAAIEIDWKSRSLLAGQDKPIFAPRNPNSLAQVWVSPLTGAGNLWRWQPQVRFEQRFPWGEATQLRAQVGVIQTYEDAARVPGAFVSSLEHRRPGLEGRFELSHRWQGERRIEVAPGFHVSTTHVAGDAVPSSLFSLDWFANPLAKLEFSGAFFTGQNVAHLGALNQGFTILGPQRAIPVHSRGGWSQLTWLATSRLSFNLFGGQHDDRNRDLRFGDVGKNLAGGANFMYRLAPNVIFSFEAFQVRTNYLGAGLRRNNHYDLAVAYLF